MNKIYCGDNLEILDIIKDNSINLIYVDPPFNTGVVQKRKRTNQGEEEVEKSKNKYNDHYENYLDFLVPRLKKSYEKLKENGSMFVHLNYKEIHYVKVEMDKIFGRNNFLNEIIYCWDFGAKGKKRWPTKHDNLLWYVKDKENYTFNYDNIDRIPYKSPEFIRNTSKNAEEKIKKGKIPTSVWEMGIVHTMSKENMKYPTQKPLKLLNRIINVHSNKGDLVLDFFAGSGSFGEAAISNERNFILIDQNKQAFNVMKERFKKHENIEYIEQTAFEQL